MGLYVITATIYIRKYIGLLLPAPDVVLFPMYTNALESPSPNNRRYTANMIRQNPQPITNPQRSQILFEAFFSEQKDVSNRQVLTQEIQSLGLNVEKALTKLDDDVIRKRVQDQELYWRSSGVSAVPTMIFNDSSVLTGAQPVDVYKQVFAELIEQ